MISNYKSLVQKNSLKDKIYSLNISLILVVLSISIISCFAIYSTDGGEFNYHTKSHILRLVILIPLFLVMSFINVKVWFKIAYLAFIIFFILLVSVKFFGLTISGSKRWLPFFFINLQPSELMKVGIIIFLSKYYHRIPYEEINSVKNLVTPLIVLFVPLFFIIDQPDLGTSLLYASCGVIMMWLAGTKLKFFLYTFITALCLSPFTIIFLKPYQKLRILTFLNPDRDPLGAGYQIIQSKIAVGSGGLTGKGFLNGSQSYLEYLPEKHTDFIFTLFSEEFGFVGSSILLFLFIALIYIIAKIGVEARSNFAKLYCYGFSSSIFVFISVNMAMVLGLLPIVGSPLPIMSYGGSALLSMMLGLAVVMSCHIHKKEVVS